MWVFFDDEAPPPQQQQQRRKHADAAGAAAAFGPPATAAACVSAPLGAAACPSASSAEAPGRLFLHWRREFIPAAAALPSAPAAASVLLGDAIASPAAPSPNVAIAPPAAVGRNLSSALASLSPRAQPTAPAPAAFAAPASPLPVQATSSSDAPRSPLPPLSPTLDAATNAAAARQSRMASIAPPAVSPSAALLSVAAPAPAPAAPAHPVATSSLPFDAAATEPPAGFQLGFSSGSGKRVQISSAAMRAAQARMKRMQVEEAAIESHPASAAPTPATLVAPPSPTPADAAAAAPADADPPVGFQLSSGRGARVQISDAAMRAAADKMRQVEAEATLGPMAAAALAAAAAPPPIDAEPPAGFQLGFSSGRGARVKISDAAMRAAASRMKQMEAEEAAVGNGAPTAAASPAIQPAAAAGAFPALASASGAAAEPPAGFQLGFSSGRGARVQISNTALRAAQERMKRLEAEEASSAAAAAGVASSPHPTAVPAASASDPMDWDAFPPLDPSAAAGPALPPPDFELGFSTGKGSRVAISAQALKQAEAKMREVDDDAAAAAAPAQSARTLPGAAAALSSRMSPAAAASGGSVSFHTSATPFKRPGALSGPSRRNNIAPSLPLPIHADESEQKGEEDAATRPLFTGATLLDGDVDMAPSAASADAQPPAGFQLGFSSGSGARVKISDAAMRAAAAKMRQMEAEEAAKDNGASATVAQPLLPPVAPRAPVTPPTNGQRPQQQPQQQVFSAEALALAKAFMEQEDSPPRLASAPVQLDPTASDPSRATVAPNAALLSTAPLSSERIKAAAALMDEFDDAAQEQPMAQAVTTGALMLHPSEAGETVPAVAAAPESAGLMSPAAGGGTAAKRRKSNFSNALPMPVDEETEDALPSDTPPQQQPLLHTPQQPPRHPAQHQQAAITPMQAARPPNIPLSAAPPSALATRKRRSTAFVSPRVVTPKPVLTLTALQQQPSLLSVNRSSNNNGGGAASKHQAANGAAQQLAMHFPVLGSSIPPPVAVPPSEKVSLLQFAARCQAKIEALANGLFASHSHASCTDIPVELISSVNAAQVQFVPPLGAADGNGGGLVLSPPVARLGWLDVRAALLAQGLDSKVCSIEWVRNQYRWVVWKLACYDRQFGAALPAPACTFTRVVQQCRARFERECNRVQQPALRKILEGDDAPGKYLVLLVAQIIKPPVAGATPATAAAAALVDDSGAIPPRPAGCDVELSDGWYSVWCKPDPQLQAQIMLDKIRVGQKLRIWGAQLEGDMPTTPLENRTTFLKIHINGTRRARWDAKLGVQRRCAFLVNMASLRPEGGPAPAVRVVVCKQYPMVYLHPPDASDAPAPQQQLPSTQGQAGSGDSSGPKVRKLHCNQRAHEKRMAAFEKWCETRLEKLRQSFEQRRVQEQQRAPATAEEHAAEEEEWAQERAALEADFDEKRKQVVPYLKLHMCELTARSSAAAAATEDGEPAAGSTDASLCWSGQCCLFTVWRPFDDHLELLQPGKELIIYGLAVHARYKPRPGQEQPHIGPVDPSAPPHASHIAPSCHYLQLSTSRHTNIVPRALVKQPTSGAGGRPPTVSMAPATHIPLRSDFLRKPIFMRPGDLWSMPRLGEFDLVCVVLWSLEEDEQLQQVGPVGGSNGGGSGATVRLFRRRRLLVAGMSGDMLLLDVNESKEHIYFPSGLIHTPLLLLIENLQYTRFEKKLCLHTAQATSLTSFKPKTLLHLASLDHGSVPPSTPGPVLTHALYAHPSLSLFHAWSLSQPAAMLFDTILQLVQRMIRGEWCGDQASSLNKDELAALLNCPVTGHIMPLMTPAATSCSISISLTHMLLPPPPPIDASVTDANSADKHAEVPAAAAPHAPSASTPLGKKRPGPSLLSAGSYKPPPAALQPAPASHGDESPIGADCAAADGPVGFCYHPSHALSLLLDASHWSVQLCLDDNAAGRWPLQLDSHAFRRVISLADTSDDGSHAHRLRDSWLDLLRTGEVPFVSLLPVSGAEDALLAALLQLRRHVFQQLALKLQLDEAHQAQHVADFIMLVLSHSAVLPADKCLEAAAALLAGASPRWAAAFATNAASGASVAVVSSAAAAAPSADSSSPPPLVSTHIVCSLSQPDQVCVQVQYSQLEPEAASVEGVSTAQPMDTSAESATAQEGADEAQVDLSVGQLSQLHELLSHLHVSEVAPSAPTSSSSSPPLLFFTHSEWSALCEELFSVLSVASFSLRLAECERHVAPAATANGLAHQAKPRGTPQQFRSVFIPHPEHITRN